VAGPGHGVVRFSTLDGMTVVDVPMGDGAAQITGGDGGWTTEERWGLPPVTLWKAPEPVRQTFPVLYGSAGGDDSIEGGAGALRSLATPRGARESPPPLRISGPAVEGTSWVWVIESLAPLEGARRRAGDGDRVYQGWTVTLLKYEGIDVIVERSPAKRSRTRARNRRRGRLVGQVVSPSGGIPGVGRTHTLRTGETLAIISARAYGDARHWKAIAAANNITDPNNPGKPGRVIALP
jgi:hypothetical protein